MDISWLFKVFLLTIGFPMLVSELVNDCIREGSYLTVTFWCPTGKIIFIAESYRGCNNGNNTTRCEDRSPDHHICKEDQPFLTDLFRKGCNKEQSCNFNQYLQVNMQGNLRFYVYFTCTEITDASVTISPSDHAGSITSDQVFLQSEGYPKSFEAAHQLDISFDVSGTGGVSMEIEELLEESGTSDVCIIVDSSTFGKTYCSGSGATFHFLSLPAIGARVTLRPGSGAKRIRFIVVFTASIPNTKFQLNYRRGPPPQPDHDPNNERYPLPPPIPQTPIPQTPIPQTPIPKPPAPLPGPPDPIVHQAPGPISTVSNPQPTPIITTRNPKTAVKQDSNESKSGNLPIILGSVAGGTVALIAFIILAVCLAARKNASKSTKEETIGNAKTSQKSPEKNLNVCEYFDVSLPKADRSHDNNCYYEESDLGTHNIGIRPPPLPDAPYSELQAPTIPVYSESSKGLAKGAVYSTPYKNTGDQAPPRPPRNFVPKGAVRVF